MTEHQRQAMKMLAKALADGDTSAREPLYDLVCELGYPGAAEAHLGQAASRCVNKGVWTECDVYCHIMFDSRDWDMIELDAVWALK